jgi:hypothetical protein
MATLLAPDTNFHLGYRSIDTLHPRDLIPEATGWVIAATVVAELDDREHKPVTQKIRDRAMREKKVLGNAIESRTPLSTGASLHYARTPLSYAAHNVNKDLPDERILGELLQFRDNNPGDEIIVISHDLHMRIEATNKGFKAQNPPDAFRLPDIPTTTETQLRKFEARVRELEDAAPRLELAFAGSTGLDKGATVCAALPSDVIDAIVSAIEPDPLNKPFLPTPQHSYQLNHRYDTEFKEYCAELRAYIVENDRASHRVVELDFELSNDGLIPAERVKVEFSTPPTATLRTTPLERADPPGPPTRYTYARISDIFKLAQTAGPGAPLPSLYSRQRDSRDSGEHLTANVSERGIAYDTPFIPQHEKRTLPSIYLVLKDDFREPIVPITYRIRAANAPGELTGSLTLRLTWNPPDSSSLPDFNSISFRIEAARNAKRKK